MRRPLLWLLALSVAGMIAAALWSARARVPENAVLVLELGGELDESPPRDLLGQWQARGPALPSLLLLLDMAVADERVKGVLVHVRPLSVGYARIQELRDALSRVRSAGKPVIALIDATSLNATRELYLASSADKIFVEPASLAPLAGISGQFLHLAGFFEKIGVEWQVSRVGIYKSAVEQFAAREMSPKAREMTDGLLDGIFAQIVDGIAAGRGLEPAAVRALIDAAPGTPDELVAAKLADGIAARQEVLEKAGLTGANELESDSYIRVDATTLGLRSGPTVALVFGEGAIVEERGRGFSKVFAADETVKALDAAAEDDAIRAVVLRVNSPGGGAQPSDKVWRALARVRAKKPVVVSMADAAASGGYYVASGANAIVAEPATLTGSIGVFLLRPSFVGLYEKLAIDSEVIERGAYASVTGGDRPFTPEQQARTDSFIAASYRDFVSRVAEGRGLSTDAVDALGQGRVWLGSDAFARKLVDEVGGLRTAVERARREAGIENEPDPVRLILPAPRSPTEQVRELIRGDVLRDQLLRALLPADMPFAFALDWLPLDGALAYLPPYWIEIH
ncbi:MAG: signal peptide peptidase SppA [Myxococcota bacterium]